MKFTEKHDKGLIDKVIKRYDDYLDGKGFDGCAFCKDAFRETLDHCTFCVLVRIFNKQCFDYLTYNNICRFGSRSNIKMRMAVLKRLKHYIKGDWVG